MTLLPDVASQSAGIALTRFVSSMSLPSFFPAERHARLRLPCRGSFGPQFPTFSATAFLLRHRYYAPLSLPTSHLGSLRLSLTSRYFAGFPPFVSRLRFISRRGNASLMPGLLFRRYPFSSGYLRQRLIGSPKFPSYPFECMPRPQTPVESCPLTIARSGLLPSARCTASAFTPLTAGKLSILSTTIHISGLTSRPTPLLHPVPNTPLLESLAGSLLTCWLGFSQVGLGRSSVRTDWVTSTNFLSLLSSLPSLRAYLGTSIAWLAPNIYMRQELQGPLEGLPLALCQFVLLFVIGSQWISLVLP